ncbi:preprotein translocase SecA subunit [Mycoplasmopsis californica HAZ160_1]|uniref:Protein translocase subunit SecA n=2 Tax=Mycoplasmopsis californica TaxID=2113 RepID=A0A059XWL3_9BACT|nr:preprotein translocase subunit SecA [Mycoplasmopsis californica]AIA29701.1 preprotein translocase subunit SecA [Mycoplasmopsis californica]BAP00799.1 preprotein translocase SecA subunit [Mycoplasmopsis californica HAZ160_1]BBG40653.1 preprotein translocase SecA subunit [Mycoplasmopsis californica]BBG41248.1 preprotein translocase SecA subunit [Mycoplasmopsis californica]BBG41841.1 preprotein translocase SecA subunit [Mycoplasmopsis californica]
MKLFEFKSTEMRIAEKALKKINQYEPIISKLSDRDLQNKTVQFKARLSAGETLESMRAEVFAVSREATKRVLGKRPYDVQMLGGLLLDMASVAEMKTGEGKTITSIAPVYLNALEGKGAIVSTVNEYLSERDAIEMGQVFNWLGMSVGINKAQMDPESKRAAYAADITYSVHSELGFDYLRDNMASSMSEKVQRGLNFCLIDEADSILIDEAKTPLIISGGEGEDTKEYFLADRFVRTLTEDDYEIDEETKAILLTFSGVQRANSYFGYNDLYSFENSEMVHRIQNSLRAHKVMRENVEYIVRDGKIELVDAFTGRIMEGRAYSEGLQQAIQACAGVEIENETKTLATITYQNFFRMFTKLCGMTGTAKTEEQEFIDIYNMRVNVVPTNKPVIRKDLPDSIFATAYGKWTAVTEKIKELYEKGQPVLVGTAQIEDSEILHSFLLQAMIPHTVLNAKQNASEAQIIADAGQVKSVTIATNMAGRGTDIKLSPEAKELGGLYVIGTDRAESRRIDNQLRGRSGRQGDPGTSKFYVSLDDQLMRRFANYLEFKEQFKDKGDSEITTKSLISGFEAAQKKIEGFNYDSRKSVLHYDDVIRQQRDVFYTQRDLILVQEDISHIIERMMKNAANSIVNQKEFLTKTGTFIHDRLLNYLNNQFLGRGVRDKFNLDEISKIHESDMKEYLIEKIIGMYQHWRENYENFLSKDYLLYTEKNTVLSVLDRYWQNHINTMDKLRSNVNLVQYSQKNPYQVYTEEGSKKFDQMLANIATDVSRSIFDDRQGADTLIPVEVRNDPLFLSIRSIINFDDDNMSDVEKEKQWLELYYVAKENQELAEQQQEVANTEVNIDFLNEN